MPFKFHGGVHPNYMKAPDVPVTVIAPPPQVVLPMMQHIGAPCKPLVAVGDYVKMGQKIADNPAPVSAPIHATVSGKVIAIEPRPHPLGDMIPAIVIENDFQDTPCTDLAPLTPEQMKDPEAILERIREAYEAGIDTLEEYRRNKEKAALLYDEIDRNPLFVGTATEEDRSLMNICFVMAEGCEELAPEFMEFAKSRGMVGIKGHRLVGGFRASCYNALPKESVEALVACMQEFARKHGK